MFVAAETLSLQSSAVVTTSLREFVPLPGWVTQNRATLVFEDDQGLTRLFEPKPGVVVCQTAGVLSEAAGAKVLEAFRRILARGDTLTSFWDWELMSNYAPNVRATFTNFVLENRAKTKAVNILLKSKIVSIGVRAAAVPLMLADLEVRSTTNRAEWETGLSALRQS